MASVNFSLVRDEKGTSLTVYIDDGVDLTEHVLGEAHANFKHVRDYLLDTPEDEYDVEWIKSQVDVLLTVGTHLNALSERVRVTDTNILFDGDPLENALTNHIVRLVREGASAAYAPLVAFLEKVQTNPSDKSVDSLYSWLKDRNFSFTPDGDFIAYKGVAVDKSGNSISINHGKAIVNGKVYSGAIPNPDGAVVEMPRSEVEANTAVGCASGLHAGTWKYASAFARGRVLVVKINPRDVVSVPDDCEFQKLRVSRYVVLSTIDQEFQGTTYAQDDEEYEDEYEDEWDDEDYWGDGDEDY
jgi:hypothetical protein